MARSRSQPFVLEHLSTLKAMLSMNEAIFRPWCEWPVDLVLVFPRLFSPLLQWKPSKWSSYMTKHWRSQDFVDFCTDVALSWKQRGQRYQKMRTIWEDFQGFYQGLTATMAKQGSNQAIRFFVMETLKDWYRGGDSNVIVSKPLTGLFGAIAGAASVWVFPFFPKSPKTT